MNDSDFQKLCKSIKQAGEIRQGKQKPSRTFVHEDPDPQKIRERLLSAGLVPANVASDAIHIATASVHAIDFLVTWNFKHILNPHIQEALREEVASFGERLPVICTPEELLRDEGN